MNPRLVRRLDLFFLTGLLVTSGLAAVLFFTQFYHDENEKNKPTATYAPTSTAVVMATPPATPAATATDTPMPTPTLTDTPTATITSTPRPTPFVTVESLVATYAGEPLVVSGSAQPGALILVHDQEALIGSGTAADDGGWMITVPGGLPAGHYVLSVEAIVLEGDTISSAPLSFDLASPVTPTPKFTLTPTSSATSTLAPSPTMTSTATETPSVTPSVTPSPTLTSTVTGTATPTATETPSVTPSDTPSPTMTSTATETPSVTPSDTPAATVTPEQAAVVPTDTATPTPTATQTATFTATATGTATATDTPSPIPPTATAIPTDTPTATYTATATATATATDTPSPIPPSATAIPTNTPTATYTATATATATATDTPSPIPPTATAIPTDTPTATFTATATATTTAIPSETPTATFTVTASATATAIPHPEIDTPTSGAVFSPGPVVVGGTAAPGAEVQVKDLETGEVLAEVVSTDTGAWQTTIQFADEGTVVLVAAIPQNGGLTLTSDPVMITVAPPVQPSTGMTLTGDPHETGRAFTALVALLLAAGGFSTYFAGRLIYMLAKDRTRR